MKRNRTKHTNVVPVSEQTAGNILIMSTPDGQKVKATDVKLLPQFGAVMQQIAQAKGINIDENADKILDMVEIWSPDALSKPATPNEKPKKIVKKTTTATSEEKPKKIVKKTTTATSEEKPKKTVKKTTVKKTTTATSEEKPKKTTRKKKTDTKT